MADLMFYGASDDLVEVEGVHSEEYPTEDCKFVVESPDGVTKCFVRVVFEDNGCWSVSCWPADEDVPMFPGTVKLNDRGYSAVLTLDVPEGTHVTSLTVDPHGEPVG